VGDGVNVFVGEGGMVVSVGVSVRVGDGVREGTGVAVKRGVSETMGASVAVGGGWSSGLAAAHAPSRIIRKVSEKVFFIVLKKGQAFIRFPASIAANRA
jgi:hypothetical protein